MSKCNSKYSKSNKQRKLKIMSNYLYSNNSNNITNSNISKNNSNMQKNKLYKNI